MACITCGGVGCCFPGCPEITPNRIHSCSAEGCYDDITDNQNYCKIDGYYYHAICLKAMELPELLKLFEVDVKVHSEGAPIVCSADNCEDSLIKNGDAYFEIGGDFFHLECIDDMSFNERLEFLDVSVETA